MKTTPAKTDTQTHRINADLLASLLLIVLGVIFFADVLFTSKHFYYRDILNFHYALHKVLIDSYAAGNLPLWNPFVYLGQPLLANPNYLAFYPSNLLHMLVPCVWVAQKPFFTNAAPSLSSPGFR